MSKTIDARGLACPQPVMLTIKALEDSDEVTTIVDSEEARENVLRLGGSQNAIVSIDSKPDGIYLTLKKTGQKQAEGAAVNTVLFVGSDTLGRGDNLQLGSLLMQSFFHTLNGLASRPETGVFINSGVKLVTTESIVLGELQELAKNGVEILACGTCLSRFQLTDKVAVGQVSNMYTIADTLMKAGKVLSL